MKLFFIILSIIFFIIFCASAFFFNYPLKQTVVYQSCQPEQIHYKSFDPYCLSVIERAWIHKTDHYLFIGHGKEAPTYGYYFPFDFYYPNISASHTEWNSEGVEFLASEGRRLFIPKKLFTAGR